MEVLNREDFTFFWGGVYSQWAPSKFTIDGVEFNTAEQYMMYKKALMFHDYKIAEKVMNTTSPRDQKMLGKEVKNFNKELWETHCIDIVADANYAKFTQNYPMLLELENSIGTEIVEASPEDRIWGIGLHENDSSILDRDKWKGTNWLGVAIMRVRTQLIEEGTISEL